MDADAIANGKPLNQPWGFAIAPKHFGPFSKTLLVSNNTNSGTINSFNAIAGQFVGTLTDPNGEVIHIDQLWGIKFGDGTEKMMPRGSLSSPRVPSISLDCSVITSK
jgi:hypothetical protein